MPRFLEVTDEALARDALGAAPSSQATAVKSAAYTASVGDIVLADVSDGGFTVTIPSAPHNGSQIWVKKIDASEHAVTVQRSGSDVFNVAETGPSLLQLTVPDEAVCVQYKDGVWHVIVHGFAPASLDERYFRLSDKLPDTNGNTALQFTAGSNPQNWLNVYNGNAVLLRASGFDANIGLSLISKGAEGVYLYGSNTSVPAAVYTAASTPINYWQFSSANAGSSINCLARSSGSTDANVSFNFVPRGTGQLRVNNVAVATQTDLATKLDTTGNAATATQLATARKISGVSFDGSADINTPSAIIYPPQYVSANYYYTTPMFAATTTAAQTNNRLGVTPWFVIGSLSVARFVCEVVTTAGEAGSTFRIGVWSSDSNGLPSTLVYDAGTVAVSATGVQEITLGSPLVLTSGLYWVGGVVNNAPTTPPTMRVTQNVLSGTNVPLGTTIPSALNSGTGGIYVNSITAAFATSASPFPYASAFLGGAQVPRIAFKVS